MFLWQLWYTSLRAIQIIVISAAKCCVCVCIFYCVEGSSWQSCVQICLVLNIHMLLVCLPVLYISKQVMYWCALV